MSKVEKAFKKFEVYASVDLDMKIISQFIDYVIGETGCSKECMRDLFEKYHYCYLGRENDGVKSGS